MTAFVRLIILVLLIGIPSQAFCSILPSGVQLNVPVTTVEGAWGWTKVYQGDYGTSGVAISTVFAGVQPTDYVMLAAKQKGTSNFALLAATLASDAMAHTPQNATTSSNGAEWYWNGGSIGFAGGGDPITQFSADIEDSSFDSFAGANGELRLSWHTGGPSSFSGVPTVVDGGWRAGTATSLNGSNTWERFVYVAQSIDSGNVPEPSSIIVWGLLGAVGLKRQRRAA